MTDSFLLSLKLPIHSTDDLKEELLEMELLAKTLDYNII